jgi:HK97 family phage prohead protease
MTFPSMLMPSRVGWRRERVHGGRSERLVGSILDVQLGELRADTPSYKTMTGRAVPYGQWTPRLFYLLSIGRGSLDKSISEAGGRLPLLLWHNDLSFPIGISEDWDSRSDALYGKWRWEDTEEAQRAARAAKNGSMTGLSIRFGTILADWELSDEPYDDTRMDIAKWDRMTLVEGRMTETSLTPTPAYANAQVSTVLSRPATRQATPALDSWKAYLASLSIQK